VSNSVLADLQSVTGDVAQQMARLQGALKEVQREGLERAGQLSRYTDQQCAALSERLA